MHYLLGHYEVNQEAAINISVCKINHCIPVLEGVLRVRDGRRVPDKLEPCGGVALQLQQVRG